MKKYFSVLLVFFTISVSSQTKKETEDWLTYFLNKYCSTNFDDDRLKNDRNKDISWASYSWVNYSYEFPTEGVFRVTANRFRKDEHNRDSLINFQFTDIKIHRIIRIEKKINLDSNSLFDNRMASLDFDFSEPSYNSKGDLMEQSAVIHHQIDNKYDTPKREYANSVVAVVSLDQSALRGDALDRIKKAFEHLVTLLNGKIIKDIF